MIQVMDEWKLEAAERERQRLADASSLSEAAIGCCTLLSLVIGDWSNEAGVLYNNSSVNTGAKLKYWILRSGDAAGTRLTYHCSEDGGYWWSGTSRLSWSNGKLIWEPSDFVARFHSVGRSIWTKVPGDRRDLVQGLVGHIDGRGETDGEKRPRMTLRLRLGPASRILAQTPILLQFQKSALSRWAKSAFCVRIPARELGRGRALAQEIFRAIICISFLLNKGGDGKPSSHILRFSIGQRITRA